jgi:hypothetical protein
MVVELSLSEQDDQRFVDIVKSIVASLIDTYEPDNFYVVKVDNWFDYKWLFFEGKKLGAVPVHMNNPIIVPPFSPNRIKQQISFKVDSNGDYEDSKEPPLHFKQPSEKNLKRKLFKDDKASFVLWWSGETKSNEKGSVMLYRQIENVSKYPTSGIDFWYVSFIHGEEWKIHKTKYISPNIIEELISRCGNGRNQKRTI